MSSFALDHLDDDSSGAGIRGKDRPQSISVERTGSRLALAAVSLRSPGSTDPIELRQEFLVCRHSAGERDSHQFFLGFTGEEAKSRVDIADDVAGSLHCGHR